MKKLTKLNNQHFVNGGEPRGNDGPIREVLGFFEFAMVAMSILVIMIVNVVGVKYCD